MNHSVIIEESLCIGCGACASDCPASNIELVGKETGVDGSESGKDEYVFDNTLLY